MVFQSVVSYTFLSAVGQTLWASVQAVSKEASYRTVSWPSSHSHPLYSHRSHNFIKVTTLPSGSTPGHFLVQSGSHKIEQISMHRKVGISVTQKCCSIACLSPRSRSDSRRFLQYISGSSRQAQTPSRLKGLSAGWKKTWQFDTRDCWKHQCWTGRVLPDVCHSAQTFFPRPLITTTVDWVTLTPT